MRDSSQRAESPAAPTVPADAPPTERRRPLAGGLKCPEHEQTLVGVSLFVRRPRSRADSARDRIRVRYEAWRRACRHAGSLLPGRPHSPTRPSAVARFANSMDRWSRGVASMPPLSWHRLALVPLGRGLRSPRRRRARVGRARRPPSVRTPAHPSDECHPETGPRSVTPRRRGHPQRVPRRTPPRHC